MLTKRGITLCLLSLMLTLYLVIALATSQGMAAEAPCNPNGSFYAIEGIVSEDGRILGKMGHTERYGENLFKNICGEKRQPIFENAVAYFRKRN